MRRRDESRQFRQWKYILAEDGRTPVPIEDPIAWARWIESPPLGKRQVDRWEQDDIIVSTVFLALDHSWSLASKPLLWETMIFWKDNDQLDNAQWRYSSREDAQAGHHRAVAVVQAFLAANTPATLDTPGSGDA